MKMGTRVAVCAAVVGILAFAAAQAYASPTPSSIDGSLADWGVTPGLLYADPVTHESYGTYTLNGTDYYPYSRLNTSSLLPTGPNAPAHVVYVIRNDGPILGGEAFDVEALYATMDDNYAYFAVVTSTNPNGTRWDGYRVGNTFARFGPGDLRLEVSNGLKTIYGIGARPFGLDTHDTAVTSGPTDERTPASWDSVDQLYGSAHLTTSNALIVSGATWTHVNNWTATSEAYFDASTGSIVGHTKAAWNQQFAVGDYYEKDVNGWDEPYGTWIYEVCVSRAAVGLAGEGTEVTMSVFAADCSNDSISAKAYVHNGEFENVPEVAALGVVGLGLGILALKKRRS